MCVWGGGGGAGGAVYKSGQGGCWVLMGVGGIWVTHHSARALGLLITALEH